MSDSKVELVTIRWLLSWLECNVYNEIGETDSLGANDLTAFRQFFRLAMTDALAFRLAAR